MLLSASHNRVEITRTSRLWFVSEPPVQGRGTISTERTCHLPRLACCASWCPSENGKHASLASARARSCSYATCKESVAQRKTSPSPAPSGNVRRGKKACCQHPPDGPWVQPDAKLRGCRLCQGLIAHFRMRLVPDAEILSQLGRDFVRAFRAGSLGEQPAQARGAEGGVTEIESLSAESESPRHLARTASVHVMGPQHRGLPPPVAVEAARTLYRSPATRKGQSTILPHRRIERLTV